MGQKNPRNLRRGGRWDGGGNLLTVEKVHGFVEFIQKIVAVFLSSSCSLQCLRRFLICRSVSDADVIVIYVSAVHGWPQWSEEPGHMVSARLSDDYKIDPGAAAVHVLNSRLS